MATQIESKEFVSGDFKRQLQGYGLTTAQILYRLPTIRPCCRPMSGRTTIFARSFPCSIGF